jgi:CxxC motif-containing protein (DUF1111 family)
MSARMLRGRGGTLLFLLAMAFVTAEHAPVNAATKTKSGGPPATNLASEGLRWFTHQWKPRDPASRDGDGLGPVYNARSCFACHNQGGIGGGGPVKDNVQLLSLQAPRNSQSSNEALIHRAREIHPGLAEQPVVVMHRFAVSERYAAWRQQRVDMVTIDQRQLPSLGAMREDGITDDGRGGFSKANRPSTRGRQRSSHGGRVVDVLWTGTAERTNFALRITERNTTALFGDGLIDQIPDAVIKAQVSQPEANPTLAEEGIPVRTKVVLTSDGKVGKFGWKAQHATLANFALTACAVEVGLEVPDHHQGSNPLRKDYVAPGYDMNEADCESLVAFLSVLPMPRRETPQEASPEQVLVGEVVFNRIGCAACHRRTLGDVDGLYSDLLVHDMGTASSGEGSYSAVSDLLASKRGVVGGTVVSATEWRTPPLWGVADSAPYMHDGRAATIEQAIVAHDGEAKSAASRFSKLDADEKVSFLAFLASLRAPYMDDMASIIAQNERR